MQTMTGSTVSAGGLLLFYLSGSPLLLWIAIISVVLGACFLVHVVLKRRKEAREAHGLALPLPRGVST